jgi:O-antigen/teichoic acid export membrane protein
MGSRVLLLLAVARFCSSDSLAYASYAVAIAEAVRVVADGGMEVWALREIGRASEPSEQAQSTATMAVIKVVYGLIGGLLAAIVTLLTSNAGLPLALLAAVLVLAGELFAIGLIHHVSRSTPQKLVPISILAAAATVTGGVFALAQGYDAVWAIAIAAAVELMAGLYVAGSLVASKALVIGQGIVPRSLEAMRQSFPTTVYSAVAALHSRLDAIALNLFSASALALYSVAFRATQPFLFAFGAVALALYGSQTRERDRSPEQSRRVLRRTLITVFFATSAAAVVVYVVCAWLIVKIIPAYAGSLGALRILCVLMPVIAVNCIGMYALAGQGRFGALLGVATANLIAAAILLAVLVPIQGAEGAALSLLGSQLVGSVCLYVQHARTRLERAVA